MSNSLSYRMSDSNEIHKLCDSGVLERCNWLEFDHDDFFVVFSENGTDIGVVQLSKINNSTARIEMIEVSSEFRSHSYGTQIVKLLQAEFDTISCSPIYTSDTFFRKLGFTPDCNNCQFWFWNK